MSSSSSNFLHCCLGSCPRLRPSVSRINLLSCWIKQKKYPKKPETRPPWSSSAVSAKCHFCFSPPSLRSEWKNGCNYLSICQSSSSSSSGSKSDHISIPILLLFFFLREKEAKKLEAHPEVLLFFSQKPEKKHFFSKKEALLFGKRSSFFLILTPPIRVLAICPQDKKKRQILGLVSQFFFVLAICPRQLLDNYFKILKISHQHGLVWQQLWLQ